MARFNHNGVEYEELGNGKVRVIGQAAAQQPYTVTALPLTPEQQAEADRRRSDQAIQEQAAREASAKQERERRDWEATHNPDGSPKVKPQEAPAGYRYGADGNLQFIPGGPADPAMKGGATPPKSEEDRASVRAEAVDKIKLARDLIARSRNGWFTTGFGSGAAGYFKGTPAYDLAQDTETLKNAGALTRIMEMSAQNGGKNPLTPLSNSDFQALASSLSNLETGQSDAQYQANVQRVIDLYQRAYAAAGGTDLEGDIDPKRKLPALIPVQNSNGTPGANGGGNGPVPVSPQPSSTPGSPLSAAPAGSTTQAVPIPAGMQDELNAYFAQKGRDITAPELGQFVRRLYAKYGAEPGSGLDEYAATTAKAIQDGGAINTNIPPNTVPLTGTDKLRNDVVNTDLGAFAATMGNAGGFGIPGLAAGDQLSALREAHPISSTIGDVAGGITGTFAAGAGLGAASRFATNPVARGILANPMTADVLYGSTYGATQADDPLYGAVVGGLSAAGGSYLGGKVGGWLGPQKAKDTLNRGERALFDGIDRSGVEAALLEGQNLGLPMTLADVDPVAAALTGSSIRRSPTVAGQARDVLGRRSQGQLDRFRAGIERDLGPLDNVPERADALIQQARTRAGPLYDEAYATPVPSTPELDSLLNTPFGREAIGRSRTIAANERRSPTELGFALDDAGNPVLNPIPNDAVARHLVARDALDQAQAAYRAGTGSADDIVAARQGLRDAEAALNAAPTPGAMASVPTYTTQSLDYAKQGMDDILEANRNQITGRLELGPLGRSQNGVLRALLGEVDDLNPAYAQARAAYAGPAAERQALFNGRAAMTENPDLVAIQAANQTPERLEMMQLGARDRLNQGAEGMSNSRNPYSLLNTPAMERRLESLYPDSDVGQLMRQRDLELQMAGTSNSLIGNSASAERIAADQSFADPDLLRTAFEGAVETAFSGAPVVTTMRSGLGNRIADALRLGAGKRATEKAEQIAPIALNPNPTDTIAQILAMQERDALYQAAVGAGRRAGQVRGGHTLSGTNSAIAAALMRN